MDASHQMANIFDPAADLPCAAPEDDSTFLNLFSSPATQVDDTALQRAFPNPAAEQPFLQSHTQDAIAQLDSLMAPGPHSLNFEHFLPHAGQRQVAPEMPPSPKIPLTPHVVKQEPNFTTDQFLRNVPSITHSSDSDSPHPSSSSPGRKGFSRLAGRKRTLPAMRALAKRNAPNVTLSDQELIDISQMHESEQSLAESGDLFRGIAEFKNCLAKYGYRMKSLQIDSVSAEEREAARTSAFTFVLNKKQLSPSVPSDPTPSEPVAAPGGAEAEAGRQTLTSSTSEITASEAKEDAVEAEERPKKRARFSGNVRPSGSNGDATHSSCVVCCKKMTDMGNLVRHFRHAHQEKKPYMCPKCGGFYSSEGTLWHHLNNVHSEARRIHKCEYCDASYDSSGAKTRHVHGTHYRERPLITCPYPGCQRIFIFPAHLENHANAEHKGFRPFRCSECSKSFSSANGQSRHMREVHRTEKAYFCRVCKAGLTKRCHLKRHLLNVHGYPPSLVEMEMKNHPNPGDIAVLQSATSSK